MVDKVVGGTNPDGTPATANTTASEAENDDKLALYRNTPGDTAPRHITLESIKQFIGASGGKFRGQWVANPADDYAVGEWVVNDGILYRYSTAPDNNEPGSAGANEWTQQIATKLTNDEVVALVDANTKAYAQDGGRLITRTDADGTFTGSTPASLLAFAPKAPKTGRIIDQITEQHATKIHYDPDDDLGAYYSYRGDLAAFSENNQDGYIASAGVQEAGTEVIGLTNPAAPANANTATNDFLVCHEAITINSNAAHGLLAILHTSAGNSDHFKNLFRVHNRILQFNQSPAASYLVAEDAWQNVADAATGGNMTLVDGEAHFAYSINKSGNADIGLECNLAVRQGNTVRLGERGRLLPNGQPDFNAASINIPGGTWDFSKIARTQNASIFDIANKRGYLSHSQEGTLARHIDSNLLRLFGKIRISLVNTDKIGVTGNWDFAKLYAGGNQQINGQWYYARTNIGGFPSVFNLGDERRGKIAAVWWQDSDFGAGWIFPDAAVGGNDINTLPAASAHRVLQNGDFSTTTRPSSSSLSSSLRYDNTQAVHLLRRLTGTIVKIAVFVLDEAPVE